MKNIIVCNVSKEKYFNHYEKYVKAQIDNSFSFGWSKDDIILLANFDYTYEGIKSVVADLDCDFCLTGSKTFAIVKLFELGLIQGDAWLHDLDVWQTFKIDFPEILDIGMTRYIGRWQGGSVFLKPGSRDIFSKIADEIRKQQSSKEEPVIKKVLRIKEYGDRVTRIDNSYNVGATGFEKRYRQSQKPIKAIHMHPHRGTDHNRNMAGMNRLGVRTVGNGSLLNVFSKYFDLSEDLIKDASANITVDNSDYEIRELCCGEFHTNRKFSFVDVPDVLAGRKFLVLPHKRQVSIDIAATSPGIFEIGLCDEHEEIISSFRGYYEMEHIPLKTNYRDAKKIRLFRKFFEKGETLKLKHKWRVNPIIIANEITCRKK